MKKTTGKTLLISILAGLAGSGITALIVVLMVTLSQKSMTDEPEPSDGWQEIGRVYFANEYGIISFNDIEEKARKKYKKIYGKEYDYDDGKKKTALEILEGNKEYSSINIRMREAFYTAQHMNTDLAAKLYVREAGGYRSFVVRNNQFKQWIVETGSFSTEANEVYNARICIPENSQRLYFNIPQ